MPILEASIDSFTYFAAKRPSLGSIDLNIEAGEFLVLTGPAASGKTTLCYALTGVIPHSVEGRFSGQVKIGGENLNDLRLAEISRLCGFVLQTPEFQLFNLSVKDDVAFGPENLVLPPGEILERIADTLQQVGMQGFEDRNSNALSGGETQRIVLACILAMRSQLLILDQPAAELDPIGRSQIYQNLRALNQDKGMTIVVVEDRLSEVANYASRIALVEDGQIARIAEPNNFFTDRTVVTSGLRLPAVARLYHYLRENDYDPGPLDLNMSHAADRYRSQLNHSKPDAFQTSRSDSTSQADDSPIIQIEDLTYTYPTGQTALDNVSLTISEGEFTAIIGENGAGKTTLARHLIGLLQPTAGRILLQANDIVGLSTARLSNRVGFLFQDPDYQLFSNSVFEEVAFALKIRKVPKEEIEERVANILDMMDLGEVKELHPYRLSRGQRQRLALASILVHDPPVLVVDEPSTGLDFLETQEVMDVLAERNSGGKTVLFITHDMETVLRYSRRSIVMSQGSIRLDVPTSDLHHYLDDLDTAGIQMPDEFELLRNLGLHTTLASVEKLGDLILAAQSGTI